MAESGEKKTGTLTKADIMRIAALPRSKHIVAGIVQDTIVDPVTGYIYFPNPDSKNEYDQLLPKRVKPTDPSILKVAADENPNEDKEDTTSAADGTEKPEPDGSNGKDETDPPKQEKKSAVIATGKEGPSTKKPKKKGMQKIIIAAAIVVVAAACIPFILQSVNSMSMPGTTQTEPVGESVSIVQVLHPLIPGDQITESDIQEAVVSTETYNQITLQGTNLYQWQRADTLLGMYVQEYIPAGQYVAFSSVGAAYDPPVSLWSPDTYIDIPLTEEQAISRIWMPGEIVSVTIRKQTSSENAVADSQKQLASGGAQTTVQQQITVVETSIPETTICDVLTGEDATGSMYETLAELSSIPAGEQADYLANASKQDTFTSYWDQKYIHIYLPQSDIDAIGDITDPEGVTITIEPTGEYSRTDEARTSFVSSAQATIQNVLAVLPQPETAEEVQ